MQEFSAYIGQMMNGSRIARDKELLLRPCYFLS